MKNEILKMAVEFAAITMKLHMNEVEMKEVLDLHNGDVKATIRTLKVIEKDTRKFGEYII